MEPRVHYNPDEYLYRYRSMNSKDLDRIFTHNELYFASPKDLNDPFDCNPPIKLIDCKEDEYKKLWTFPFISKTVSRELKVYCKINIERIEEYLRKALKKIPNHLGVLCLSATPYDILMWSHYADKHNGIVLQFDRKGLEEKFFEDCHKIDYRNNAIDAEQLISTKQEDLYKLFLFKKAGNWKYEEEWRIIVFPENRKDKPKEPRIFEFPKKILTGIILGCEISESDKDRIVMWRDYGHPKVRIYDATRNNHSYEVNIDFDKWT